jgi:branched-chain amino acid transport system permease protein
MPVALDGSAAVRDRFESALRERLAGLVTEALVAEHAARPLGPHSDELSRVLTYFRGAPMEGKLVVIAVERDKVWRIGRITRTDPSTTPVLLEEGSNDSYEEALHAVFLQRLDDLRAETQSAGA